MAISLRCVDRDLKGETWSMEIGDTVTVRDAAGKAVAEFTPQEAPAHFQMPSFSANIKYFAIALGDSMRRFDVSRDGLREIQALSHRAVASAGPEAMRAVKMRAIRDIALGLACAILGGVLTVGSYMSAANQPGGGKYTITYGVVLFGLVVLARGIYGLIQHGRIERVAQS